MTDTHKRILAGALGLAMAVSMVAVAGGALAALASFDRNLTIGSTGADVTALQSWLIANGFSIPAGATGYFGAQTKAAVVAYQASVGLPNTGYVGPLTLAKLNAGGSVSTGVPGCAAGAMFNSMTGAPCSTMTWPAGCTAGAMFSSTTGAPCTSGTTTYPAGCTSSAGYSSTTGQPCTGVIVNTGGSADGSLTASYAAVVSSGITVKKGETKDFIGVRLSATAGPATVTRLDAHFNVRPWLFFSSLYLKDDSGNIIKTIALAPDGSNVTEVTAGSDYLVRFDGINYSVNTTADKNLIVGGTVLPTTDKIASGGTVVDIQIPSNGIRTINGLGYTDSIGLAAGSQGGDLTGSFAQKLNLGGSTSIGDVLLRISPNSPSTRIVTTSSSQITRDVVLGVFSLKLQNNSAQLNSLNNITINTNASIPDKTTAFQNVRLQIAGQTFVAQTFTSGGVTTFVFSNPLNLAQDTWTDATIMADVVATTTSASFSASTTLAANTSNIVGVDSNFSTLTTSGANTVISSDTKFLGAGISVSGSFAPLGGAIYSLGNTFGATGYNMTATLTVNNTSNSDVFVSKTPSVFLATSTNPASIASSSLSIVTVGSTPSGDTSSSYIISAGSSRTFTFSGALQKNGNSTGPEQFSITGVRFGTTGTDPATTVNGAANTTVGAASTNATNIITFGLESMNLTGTF